MSPFKRNARPLGDDRQFVLSLPPQRTDADEAKRRAKLAFAAYDEAVRRGDADTADSARARFLDAAKKLKGAE